MLPLVLSRRYPLVAKFHTAPGVNALLANQVGLSCDIPQIPLEIVTDYGDTKTHRFVYDTGAGCHAHGFAWAW